MKIHGDCSTNDQLYQTRNKNNLFIKTNNEIGCQRMNVKQMRYKSTFLIINHLYTYKSKQDE